MPKQPLTLSTARRPRPRLKQEMLINPDEVDRTKMENPSAGGLAAGEAEAGDRAPPRGWSPFITAIARRTLGDFCKMCYGQGHKPFYTDTDSIFTKAVLPVDDKKLGALKLEKKMDWGDHVPVLTELESPPRQIV